MATKFQLEVVTPDRTVISEQIESVVVPAWDGYLGVMANHAPLLCMIRPGMVSVISDDKGREFAISTGYLEVSGNRAVILADTIEEAHEIDIERAKQALERAMSVDARVKDPEEALAAADRARARIKAAGPKSGS
jgi:F-type H+-transporting ATPase subunit epsilon